MTTTTARSYQWKWAPALAAACAVLFLGLGMQVSHPSPLVRWDGRVITDVTDSVRAHHAWVTALRFLTSLGGRIVLTLLVAGVTVWLLRSGRTRAAVFLLVTAVVGNGLNLLLKALFERTRPVLVEAITHVAGFSFPSGHAMNSTVCYGAAMLVALPHLPRRARIPLMAATALLVLAVGASRVALGVHFPTDVIGGFIAGIGWVALCHAFFIRTKAIEEAKGRKSAAQGEDSSGRI